MTDTEVINAVEQKLRKASNWRLRQQLGILTELLTNEIGSCPYQLEDRRYRDAADYLVAAHSTIVRLHALMDAEFPEILEFEKEQDDE